jgi:multidrug efflux system membrane fusion protein
MVKVRPNKHTGASSVTSQFFDRLKSHLAVQPQSRRYLYGAAALALVLGGFWYGMRDHGAGGRDQARGGAAPVRVARVVRTNMPVVEHTLGTVVANTMVQVTARVQGIVDRAAFQEGQFVHKGDLLFQIDPRAFQAALAQARAVLARDQAQLRNATRDRQRYQALRAQGAISEQQRDTSDTNADMLAATVEADKAAVQIAELNLSYTQIRSPVDGKTGPLLIQPGNMVSANGATPLVTVAQIQPVKVSFSLPQGDLPRILARQKGRGLIATLDSKDTGGRSMTAPVVFTSNAVNAASGTIEMRASYENHDLALVPGQLINVTVQLDDLADAMVIPRDGVNDGPDGSYVYVVQQGKAEVRPVKILFDDTVNVAIAGEVKPGDRVITEGQLRVEPDAAVRVLPSQGRAGAGAPRKPGGRMRMRVRES